jgi:MinD-like ATPase involved in chromosome partitioning or flagellar assembly
MIRRSTELTLLDVGGDDVGATVLATLADAFKNKPMRVLQVVNPLRPFTETVAGCLKVRKEIEQAAKLTVDGIIGNANLIDETSADDIYNGYEFVSRLSEQSGLSLEFITIARELLPSVDTRRFSCPVLQIERQLVPPWKKALPFEKQSPSG